MQIINNDIYDNLGDRWYTAYDDPIALLRAESQVKTPWILEKIKEHKILNDTTKLLDIGCGAGFLSNALAGKQIDVTGIDLSDESLKVAKKFDKTKSVHYYQADAYYLPFRDGEFDVVTAMDFLEHVDRPLEIIQEVGRVLRPGGLFFFHTFNRNFLSHFVIIKLVEWLVKNTPKNMHVIDLFIKPEELKDYCLQAKMQTIEIVGIRPVFSTISLASIFSGIVPKSLRFKIIKSLKLSYMGFAQKLKST